MTDSNAPTRAPEVAPDLVGDWILGVEGQINPLVRDLDCIQIYYQVEEETDSPLYGSVNSRGPAITKFAMENGTLKASVIVQFDVTMAGQLYQFTGTVIDPQQMAGQVTLLLSAPGEPNEEGSWSAQAQGVEARTDVTTLTIARAALLIGGCTRIEEPGAVSRAVKQGVKIEVEPRPATPVAV